MLIGKMEQDFLGDHYENDLYSLILSSYLAAKLKPI